MPPLPWLLPWLIPLFHHPRFTHLPHCPLPCLPLPLPPLPLMRCLPQNTECRAPRVVLFFLTFRILIFLCYRWSDCTDQKRTMVLQTVFSSCTSSHRSCHAHSDVHIFMPSITLEEPQVRIRATLRPPPPPPSSPLPQPLPLLRCSLLSHFSKSLYFVMWWAVFNDHQRTMVLQTVARHEYRSQSLMRRPSDASQIHALERPRRTHRICRVCDRSVPAPAFSIHSTRCAMTAAWHMQLDVNDAEVQRLIRGCVFFFFFFSLFFRMRISSG